LGLEKTKKERNKGFEIPFIRKELNVSPANSSWRMNPSGMNSLSSQPTAKVKSVPLS
jgi:hypothetical protein